MNNIVSEVYTNTELTAAAAQTPSYGVCLDIGSPSNQHEHHPSLLPLIIREANDEEGWARQVPSCR